MRYQILKAITVNKQFIKPNQKPLLDEEGDPLYRKGILQIITDESKPVYFDLPPKDMTSGDKEILKSKENPMVSMEQWKTTIDEWLKKGVIREAPEAKKSGGKKDEE